MHWNEHEPLSPAGEQRREEIRGVVGRELVRVAARRRRVRRTGAATGLAVLVGVSTWLVVNPLQTQRQSMTQPVAQDDDNETVMTLVHVNVFETNPGMDQIARSSIRVDPSSVGMSNEELLQTLNDLGRPTGLAIIGGRTVVTSPVTDQEQDLMQHIPDSIERSG